MQFIHKSSKQALDSTQVNMPGSATIRAEWLARIFGCWHLKMSRPFTQNGVSRRTCLDCGAHRRFNLDEWKMVGPYYYSVPLSVQRAEESLTVTAGGKHPVSLEGMEEGDLNHRGTQRKTLINSGSMLAAPR